MIGARRYTVTLTPMTAAELEAVVSDIRGRWGRKHLVHVIGDQPASTHLADAPREESPTARVVRLEDELARARQAMIAERDGCPCPAGGWSSHCAVHDTAPPASPPPGVGSR